MTVLVGVKCTDGVVIGADSMSTSTYGRTTLLHLETDKLSLVGQSVIVAGSGAVGLGQRFTETIQRSLDRDLFAGSPLDVVRTISRTVSEDFAYTRVPFTRENGWGYGALMAAPLSGKAELIEFNQMDFQPEIKSDKLHFVSMGSGQMLAEPFMAFISRVLWGSKTPNVQTAMFSVYWALQHAIKIAPGGVGAPIRLAVLRQEEGEWVSRLLAEQELQEQLQHIDAIEALIKQYPANLFEDASAFAPPKLSEPETAN